MAKRETAAGRSKPATDAQKAAGRANLAKGRKKKQERMEAAKEAGVPPAGRRWAQLLDGTITVADLDDEEIRRLRVRGADGGFGGRRAAMPSHLVQAFHREALKRANDRIRTAVPEVVKGLLEIARDPDAKHSDRIKAYSILMDRGMGRVPETIRVEAADTWGDLLDSAMGAVDRDLVPDSPEGMGS